MSAYLFIFALEVLLVIMRDEEIKGIALEDKVLRIAAFAEDQASYNLLKIFPHCLLN